ncbi:MAG: N-acetylneuraminate synthase family protein [Spirochaetia bacterium]|nr:N-acetylneuraminate synthase family protein [Spirochaetia bacterium]
MTDVSSATKRAYLIAEIGLNHNGDLTLARKMVDAAKAAGADAVKFQLYSSKHFIHPDAKLGNGSLQDFFAQFELKPAEWEALASHTRSCGLEFFCSIFDFPSVDLYSKLAPSIIKIASCDINNRPLMQYAAQAIPGAITWISTGTASELEVESLVAWGKTNLNQMGIFQCVSCYPAKPEEYNLNLIPSWKKKFNLPVGVSDHTPGIAVSIASVTLGARAIERHFTLSHDLPGPDQKISLEPGVFSAMAQAIREVESAMGDGVKRALPSEEGPRKFGRRGTYLAHDISAGQPLAAGDLLFLRPGVEGPGPDVILTGKKLKANRKALDPILGEDLLG